MSKKFTKREAAIWTHGSDSGVEAGRWLEREAIVAWLRFVDNGGVEQRTFWSWAADDIERGEHLIGGPVIDPLRGAVATGFSIGIEGDDE